MRLAYEIAGQRRSEVRRSAVVDRSGLAVACLMLATWIAQATSAQDENEQALRDIVLHAGGVVEFQRPTGWQLSEVPLGREIRLEFTPADEDRNSNDEFWLAFHVKRSETPPSSEQLKIWLAQRMRQFDRSHDALAMPQRLVVDGHLGFVQAYAVKTSPPSVSERNGQRIVVGTAWGILEVHWQSDPSQRKAYQRVASELLTSVRINEPRAKHAAPIAESVADARAILGSWKAYRSRMRLAPDGRIVIAPDAKRLRIGNGPVQQPRPIVGRFEAREDLLEVRWNDGSRLNFRWALRDGTLLLTDHNGQTTKLNPLLD